MSRPIYSCSTKCDEFAYYRQKIDLKFEKSNQPRVTDTAKQDPITSSTL